MLLFVYSLFICFFFSCDVLFSCLGGFFIMDFCFLRKNFLLGGQGVEEDMDKVGVRKDYH